MSTTTNTKAVIRLDLGPERLKTLFLPKREPEKDLLRRVYDVLDETGALKALEPDRIIVELVDVKTREVLGRGTWIPEK